MHVLARSRMESVDPRRRHRHRDAHRRPHRRAAPTASWPSARSPTPQGLGLETAGVATDDGGFVTVDRVSRTTARGVYAAGDCTGVLMLASVAAMQGRIAMWHFLGDAVSPARPQDRCPPTSSPPPRSPPSAGRRRPSTTARSRSTRCCSPLAGNARAKMQGVHDGFVKLFCRPGTGIVVGGVVVGAARQRADPPGLDRGGRVADGRPAGPGVHRLPVDERVRRGGRPQVASRLTS